MTKNLLYLTLVVLVATFALGNSANNVPVLQKRAKYINETVCNDEVVTNREINSDIVFIFDESASMCDYIDALRKKLTTFINELEKAEANARFALVGFGGFPRIYSPFTDNTSEITNAFSKLNCEQDGQESGLEAIRMFLKKSQKFVNKVTDNEDDSYFTDINKLGWRENSTKTIILVTDEDSDLPHYEENRNSLQINNKVPTFTLKSDKKYTKAEIDKFMGFPYKFINNNLADTSYIDTIFMEPTFSPAYLKKENRILTFYRHDTPLKLGAPYQKEVDETAQLLLQENVQLFMLLTDNLVEAQGEYVANSQYNRNNPYWKSDSSRLIYLLKPKENDDSSTVTAQYGNPLLDKFNTKFDSESVLKQLKARSQDQSIQGQMLANKGFCRAFNIKDVITNNEGMVDMFYKTVVSTIQKCVVNRIPIEVDEEEEETTTKTQETTIYEEPSAGLDQDIEFRDETVCSDEIIENKEINSDIVFFFDESVSMCDYIEALRKKLQDFLDELNTAKANARFALVGFGGKPRIYSGFTSDVDAIKKAFNKLNCEQGGQESGLEAIRMFFNRSTKFDDKQDDDVSEQQYFTDVSKLEWRENSTKTVILVTDEDSDLPHFEENRNDLQTANVNGKLGSVYTNTEYTKKDINHYMGFPYYFPDNSKIPTYNTGNYMEPPFSPSIITTIDGVLTFYRSGTPLVLTDAYQKEVDQTAQLLIQENVQVFMLLNDDLATAQGAAVGNSQFNAKNPYWVKYEKYPEDDSSTITAQYGNPLLDSISNLDYSRDKVLGDLIERKQDKSVQGQVLAKKGFCRAFNIKDFVNNGNSSEMVEMFYKTVVTTMKKCVVRKVPVVKVEETTTTTTTTTTDVFTISTDVPTETETELPYLDDGEEGPSKNVTSCVSREVLDRSIDSDIVFIIDESTSMCQYINPLKEKLNDLIEGLKNANADARFAIVGFGGKPRIYSAFTRDVEKVIKAFDNLSCYEPGQESGLEAIRMFLEKSKKFINRTENLYSEETFKDIEKLGWRENSQRTMILLTDEDSDLPIYNEHRTDAQKKNMEGTVDVSKFDEKEINSLEGDGLIGFPYYLNKIYMPSYGNEVYFEPSFYPSTLTSINGIYTFYRSGSPLVLSTPYQQEVDKTAELIKKEQVQLFLLLSDNIVSTQGVDAANSQFNELSPYWSSKNFDIKDDSNTITAQYGNPTLDSLSVSEFNRDVLLNKLTERKQEKSLQGQILKDGGFCRAFNIADFTGNESRKMVELFYRNVVKTIEVCRVVAVPIEEDVTSTSTVVEETTSTEEPEETTSTSTEEETTSTEEPEETTSSVIVKETTSTEEPEETTSTSTVAEETTSTEEPEEETTSTEEPEETTSTEEPEEETTSTEETTTTTTTTTTEETTTTTTTTTTEETTTTTTTTVEETSKSTTIPEDTTTSITSETSTAEETTEAYTEITFTTDDGDETETEAPTETPVPTGSQTARRVGEGVAALAGLAGAAAAIYFRNRSKLPQGNQLNGNVFEDNVGMENPLYEGTSGQNENPLYEANVDFDSVEDNMDAFA